MELSDSGVYPDIGVHPDIEVVLDVLSQLGLVPLVCDGFHVQVGHWV